MTTRAQPLDRSHVDMYIDMYNVYIPPVVIEGKKGRATPRWGLLSCQLSASTRSLTIKKAVCKMLRTMPSLSQLGPHSHLLPNLAKFFFFSSPLALEQAMEQIRNDSRKLLTRLFPALTMWQMKKYNNRFAE